MVRATRAAGVRLSVAGAVLAALPGCSSGSEASCAYVVVLEGRSYQFVDASGVQTGTEVGTGVSPGCNDGQPVPAATLPDPLVQVVGLDPIEAVAVVHGQGQVDLLVRSDLAANPSSEVAAYFSEHPPAKAE